MDAAGNIKPKNIKEWQKEIDETAKTDPKKAEKEQTDLDALKNRHRH